MFLTMPSPEAFFGLVPPRKIDFMLGLFFLANVMPMYCLGFGGTGASKPSGKVFAKIKISNSNKKKNKKIK